MPGLDHSILSYPRSSGVLLHPTALPGAYGIGSLGPEAVRFLDFLAASGQRLWQVLPLGPTGYADSPYQCFSAFAGNPNLIALEPLLQWGWLTDEDLSSEEPGFPPSNHERIDYGAVIPWKRAVLRIAFARFVTAGSEEDRQRLEAFRNDQSAWLGDFALFMALKETHELRPWTEWEPELRDRDPEAIAAFADSHGEQIRFFVFLQWLFHEQWLRIRRLATDRAIRIIGDIPIFVAHDSADVWANRDLFFLDEEGTPTVVAGVPPDYFSATGQLWGNPIYNWDRHRETGFSWWRSVLLSRFALYDHVRIDHFRGFQAYWSIPGGAENAMGGSWVTAPGRELFEKMEQEIGELPVIAEDLGVITDEVVELIEHFGFARMNVLQFAFAASEQNDYMPHHHSRNAVVYTGTHDNDTSAGWGAAASKEDRAYALVYMAGRETAADEELAWHFVRAALTSVCQFAVIPMQDLLGQGTEHRMNLPGTTGGNWEYRVRPEQLSPELAARLRQYTTFAGRL